MTTTDPAHPASWPHYAALHRRLTTGGPDAYGPPQDPQDVRNTARYLWYRGDHEEARTLTARIWQTWQQTYGEDHPHTRQAGWWLAFLHLKTGRHDDAARLTGQLRDACARTAPAGTEDTRKDTLETLSLDAAVHRARGDFTAAAALDRTAHDRARRAFGEDDPVTLATAHNLAVSHRLTGQFGRALELDRDTHARKQARYGDGHPQTWLTRAGLALDLRETGETAGALDLLAGVADGYRDRYGPDHPATLQATRQLSETCRRQGDHTTAETLARTAHTGLTRRCGDMHPETLLAARALAAALRQTGQRQEAARLHEATDARMRRLYGDGHPHVRADADTDLMPL